MKNYSYPSNRLVYIMTGLILLTALQVSFTQVVRTLTIENPDDMVMIQEFGGLILNVNDSIKVEMVMPAEHRAEPYQSLDIRSGDIIKMANGQKLNSAKELKNIYENAQYGDEIKLGIYRDKRMTLVKFYKANPDDLPGDMQISMSAGDDQPVISSLVSAGLLLAENDGHIEISNIVDNMLPDFTNHIPQMGDIIVSIQGNSINSPEDLEKAYNQIKQGESVSLGLLHNGNEVESVFIKPEDRAMRKVIRTGE